MSNTGSVTTVSLFFGITAIGMTMTGPGGDPATGMAGAMHMDTIRIMEEEEMTDGLLCAGGAEYNPRLRLHPTGFLG